MGKWDLFVRLGLKSDDYQKGIRNARNETQGFGASLKNIKAGALAIWGAIGAAVTKFAKDFVTHTNVIGDAWGRTMASIKAQYHSVIADLSNTKFGLNTSGSGSAIGNAVRNEIACGND